ncbi:MAG: hypothetical protein ABIQ73_23285 [Acidimicrobiales bacterium]
MSNPAIGAKYVAVVVVGLVGAGAYAGVSHDGRGGAPPEELAPIVDAPTPVATTLAAQPAEPAPPAPLEPVPTRARLRSRGS